MPNHFWQNHARLGRFALAALFVTLLVFTSQNTSPTASAQIIRPDSRAPVLSAGSAISSAPLAAWSALPHHGLNGRVFALAVIGSDLFVGGEFTQSADGLVTNL